MLPPRRFTSDDIHQCVDILQRIYKSLTHSA